MTEEFCDPPWALPRKRDRHGIRTRRVHSPNLLRDIADRLEKIAGERETEAARAYVEAVLACPYWGLRSLAIRVIGRWGGRANKAWLLERASRPTSTARGADRDTRWRDTETMAARQALRPLLKAQDSQWFIDTWFVDKGLRLYPLGSGLGVVDDTALVERLSAEITSTDTQMRLAVLRMIVARWDLPDGRDLAARLIHDGDLEVRRFATHVLSHIERLDTQAQSTAMNSRRKTEPPPSRGR